MSKTNDTGMSTLEPGRPEPEQSGGKSKALRAEPREADAAVFRLDSLAPGAAQEGGAPIPVADRPRVSHAAVFFLVLVVGGGGLLFVMRKIGINPMSAIAQMKEPDVDLTKNKAPIDHKRVLRDLSESAVKAQVPIDQVQKNPFEIPEAAQAEKTEDPDVAARKAAERARKDAEGRRQKIEAALGGLKVHGIIGGSTPVARINDQAVRVGDKVGDDLFTVSAIQGRSVTLECDGQAYTLSMDEEAPKKGAPRRK